MFSTDRHTSYAREKFGGHNVQPTITQLYSIKGWHKPVEELKLNRETAEKLAAEGVTMVRVRWRLRTHEILLRRYLAG